MYMTVKDVVAKLDGKVSKTLVYKMIANGQLRSTRFGGKILVEADDLDVFLGKKKAAPPKGRSGVIVNGIELW